jgi:L-iditol 2-dehydrogenase
MKACNLHGIGDLRYEDVPDVHPLEDEVLLRVHACGICGSDVPRVFTKGTYSFPTVPGHEFAGEAVEIGGSEGAVRGLAGDVQVKKGGRYTVYPLLPCMKCSACAVGAYQQCEDYDYYGSRRDGAFAEYLAVKKTNLIPLPDRLSFEEGASAEPCAVALHAVKRAGVSIGDCIAIMGAGPIGLLAAQAAKGAGASLVIIFDADQEKVDFAKEIGFAHSANNTQIDPAEHIKKLNGGRLADAVIEAVGVSPTIDTSLVLAKRSGRVVLMGNPAGDIALSQKHYWEILRKQLEVRGTWNSEFNADENDWALSLSLIEQGVLTPARLITHRFPLERINEAFDVARDCETFSVKIMMVS